MTPAEKAALADIQGYAAANRIRLTRHARERMELRNTTFRELRAVLTTAPACSSEVEGRWRVLGRDEEGETLEVIVVVESGVLVITLFG